MDKVWEFITKKSNSKYIKTEIPTPIESYDKIVELLSNYIRIIMIQRNRRRKLRNRRIRTLKSRQRLALSRGMEDRDSIFGSVRYDPSLLESISSHLSRIRPTDI